LTPNDIPVSVFENLITTFTEHLPLWHRYWELRRRVLKTDKLNLWDVRAPLLGETPTVSYTQAVEWIAEGMMPLGAPYVNTLTQGAITKRWVDYAKNRGKRMGAFSSGAPSTHPFILMSWGDNVFSLSTLAHELGHSLHSYLSWQHQPYAYTRYGLFAAEVASNFNQAMVRAHLLEKFAGDKPFEVAILEEAMSNFHRYFFIMPTLSRFELEVHTRVEKGQAVPAKALIALLADLFAEAFGDSVVITDEDRTRLGATWMQFSTHLYANFYPYQYATGISGAHALANRVLTQGEPAVSDYLGFLSAGGSKYPLDALKSAGVDLATPEPVKTTFSVMEGYINRLETLLG
jgi:oligoendopeptidase F